MDKSRTHTVFSVAITAIISVVLYAIVSDAQFAVVVSVTWFAAIWMLFYISRKHPHYLSGGGQSRGRWDGLGIVILGVAVLRGLRVVPVNEDAYFLGLVFLLVGVYLTAYFTATISTIQVSDQSVESSE